MAEHDEARAKLRESYVTAILVSHDGVTWLTEVVAALTSQSRAIDQLIAVDTQSKDGSAQLLHKAGIKTISMPRETGFGEAISAGLLSSSRPILKVHQESTAVEWIWLIHDDCAPSPKALEELLAAVDERPNVAVAGPKLLGWYNRKHLLEVGISIAGNGARWTGLENHEVDQGQHDGVREVLAVSTAGALIRRDVFEELGGLDSNLSLFRDDVDFGWRARVAGHSVISVSSAIAYHAEAASSERRSIDVSDAFLHRPLLLDRRNAAYVVLANSSWWLLPFLSLQLLGASIFRALGFLLVKLPGYAGDEIAAVGFLLIKPKELINARKYRKKTRLLSSQVIAQFVPPRGSQIRLAFEKSRAALSRWISTRTPAIATSVTAESAYSLLNLGDEELEQSDLELQRAPSRIRAIARRPTFFISIALILITLIAARFRLGVLSGGGLSTSPASGFDLLNKYIESWHPIGLGSSASTPPWVAIIGVFSLLTLFNAKLFITLLFLLAVPLAFFGAFRCAKKFTQSQVIATSGALLYAFGSAILGAINSGRFATIVVALIFPFLLPPLLKVSKIQEINWREIFMLGILISAIAAFSPVMYWALFLWQLALVFLDLRPNHEEPQLKQRSLRRATLLFLPILLCIPWSLEFFFHPARTLLEPGILLAGGDQLSLLLANPGGISTMPLWIFSPVLLIAVIALFFKKTVHLGEAVLFLIAFSLIFGSTELTGHGTLTPVKLWMGGPLAFATLIALIAGVILLDEYAPKLSELHLDARHLLSAFVSLVCALSLLFSIGWWTTSGAGSVLRANQVTPLPAFLTANAETPERFKTLVFRKKATQLNFFIARNHDLELGDADIVTGSSSVLDKSVDELANGSGLTSSKTFSELGIRYVFMMNPVDADLVRVIDGIGGFVRTSSTRDGISWKILSAEGHINYRDTKGNLTILESGANSTETIIPGAGTISLTEKFDSRWKLLHNGQLIPSTITENGTPIFKISEAGDILLYHDGTERRGWISLQLIFLMTTVVLAAPSRRRRSQVPIEELV